MTILSERRKIPPYGLFGGAPGGVGKNVLIRKNQVQEKESKFSALLKKGDRLRIETPGGCGLAISLDMTPKIDKITDRNEHMKVNLS